MGKTEQKNNKISLTIDGRKVTTDQGNTILQAARENGIYIPTMCYLTKVEPIASCRMCVVEVDGVEGMILSCQEKAVEGAVVRTNSEELERERRNIVKLYDVNHPLECGVCDKSGECELQNATLEMGVDRQTFAAREQYRPVQNWGFISYDPSLCIMCERCVRVCTEVVGDEALQIETGGYKSTIVNVKPTDECSECGECMSVCPVGALVSSDFKYTANSWELEKIPSSCSHCSAACQLYYEVKHAGISDTDKKIYRVTNESEFSSLCGAGRFAFDYANIVKEKESVAFRRAVEAIEKADTIAFSSRISNEEALLLQRFRERTGVRLVCDEAYGYSRFMEAYSSISGKTLYSGDTETLSESEVIIVFGSRIADDAPMIKYSIAKASKRKKARVIYCHPMEDDRIRNLVTQTIRYEAGSEEGVAALLADLLIDGSDLPAKVKQVLEDLDIGYLSAESNVSEEELETLKLSMWKKSRFTIVVGEDLYNHPRVENIARFLALIEKYAAFDLIAVPPGGNSLGVSLICDLDEKTDGYTVGYNTAGDFVLSALGDGDLDMPALNQQEGTFSTLDKRVVPFYPALEYGGYELLDLLRGHFPEMEHVVELTPQLPEENGFRQIELDEIPDDFGPNGENLRGYPLSEVKKSVKSTLERPEELDSFDGTVVYRCDTLNNFSAFTAKAFAEATKGDIVLRGSSQFAVAAKLSSGQRVKFKVGDIEYKRVFEIDESLKGTVALNPVYDRLPVSGEMARYRFERVSIVSLGKEGGAQ